MGQDKLLDLYAEKYSHQTLFHVIRSLTYFEDAENNPEPIVFDKSVSWHLVKTEIIQQVKSL